MRIQLSKRSQAALTFWELLIVLAVLVMLLLIFSVSRGPRNGNGQISCGNNLKQIGIGFREWASDHGGKFPMQIDVTNGGTLGALIANQHFQALSNVMNFSQVFHCWTDKARTMARDFGPSLTDQNISYFVNLDANATNSNAFLAGDRNLTFNGAPAGTGLATVIPQSTIGWTTQMHGKCGYVLLNDGSVQSWSSSNLNWMIKLSGVATNRLLIP